MPIVNFATRFENSGAVFRGLRSRFRSVDETLVVQSCNRGFRGASRPFSLSHSGLKSRD